MRHVSESHLFFCSSACHPPSVLNNIFSDCIQLFIICKYYLSIEAAQGFFMLNQSFHLTDWL